MTGRMTERLQVVELLVKSVMAFINEAKLKYMCGRVYARTAVHLPPLPSGCDCPSCGAVGSP